MTLQKWLTDRLMAIAESHPHRGERVVASSDIYAVITLLSEHPQELVGLMEEYKEILRDMKG